jgi:MFS family permease
MQQLALRWTIHLTPQQPTRLLSRQNVLSLYLPAAILALGQGIALPALPLYTKSFEVSFALAAMVLAAAGVGGLVAGIPTGYLLDRVGRRKVILGGPLLAAVASLLTATAQSFPELLFYRFLGGVANQMWMLGRLALITDTTSDQQRGRQITSMHAVDSTGRISGPLVGGLIASAWDVRIPFIVHGVLCLLAAVPSFKLIRETVPARAGDPSPLAGENRGKASSSGDAAQTRSQAPAPGRLAWLVTLPILVFFVAQLVGAVARGALQDGTLYLYAVYTYQVDAATIGFLGTLVTAISVPIMVGAGAVMDRFGRKATIVPGFSLLAAALGLMAMTAVNGWPFPVYAGALLLVVATNTITTGCMQTLGSDIAPRAARGAFFGVSQTVVQIGHISSPLLFALLADRLSAAAGFGLLAALSLSVVLLVAILVRDPTRERRADAELAGGPAG